MAYRIHQAAPGREVRLAGELPLEIVIEVMPVKDAMNSCLKRVRSTGRGKTEVEKNRDVAGYHVGGAGTAVDIGDLPGCRRKVFVAFIP